MIQDGSRWPSADTTFRSPTIERVAFAYRVGGLGGIEPPPLRPHVTPREHLAGIERFELLINEGPRNERIRPIDLDIHVERERTPEVGRLLGGLNADWDMSEESRVELRRFLEEGNLDGPRLEWVKGKITRMVGR